MVIEILNFLFPKFGESHISQILYNKPNIFPSCFEICWLRICISFCPNVSGNELSKQKKCCLLYSYSILALLSGKQLVCI